MTSCIVCTRHTTRSDGSCGDNCWHPDISIGYLCNRCLQALRDDLDTIPAVTEFLADNPSAGGSGGGGDRSLPGGTERMDWLQGAEVQGVLWSWCRVIVEDTGSAEPTRTDVVTLGQWLRAHVEIIAGHPAVDELITEVHGLAERGRRLCGWGEQGNVIRCPSPWGESTCNRRLRVDVHRPEEPVWCSRCGTGWTSARLLLVASDTPDAWLDAQALAILVKVHEQTIRRWARGGKVRHRGQLYSVDDARQCAAG